MPWYYYPVFVSLGFCFVSCIYHLVRIISAGKPEEFSRASGKPADAIIYSFTGAMHPGKKESAFLHLPTYIAGILYHLGTFLSIFMFFLVLVIQSIPVVASIICAGLLMITTSCGFAILIKRLIKKELRTLSNPDDYISNILVTLFQFITAFSLVLPAGRPVYFILASLLMLYFPAGKLKHAIYFFAARYHLGFFYGWRGVWPPKPL